MIDLRKVIETYYKLVNLLDKELGISPNESLFEQLYIGEVLAKIGAKANQAISSETTDHWSSELYQR